MKWMRFERDGQPVLGRLEGDTVHVHDGDLFDAPRPTGESLPAASLRWLMPCVPRTMFALWNNFHAAAQKHQWGIPAEPLYFIKPAASYAGPGQPIPAAPPEAGRIAYEGELAIVIGRRAHRVSADQAGAHIFGYSCANDMTAIELLHRDPAFAQWSRAKGLPGFGVVGPVIETAFDPAGAHVRTLVGGRERQNYPLADMIFPPHELVARISHDIPLEPGDIILCGTSLGVLPVRPGSEITVAIDDIGELTNLYG